MGYVPGVQCVRFDRTKSVTRKTSLRSCELWIAWEKTDDSKREWYPWKIGIIVPNSSSNPWIRNILHVLCQVTSLSTGGRGVQFSPHCYWVWPVGNEDIWQFWALRRPCVFLLVLLAAGPKAGRETRALEWTWSPLEVWSQVELTHILDGPRNSADLGARKRHSCCCKAMCWGDIRYVPFLQQ